MAADTVVLVAAATRLVGRRTQTYAVMHLPQAGTARCYCPWPGPLTTSTVAEAVAAGAVSCNRCPPIKARGTRSCS